MTWTRLSDNYTDRPEFEDMSLSACYLDVEGGYQREWDDQMLATDVERSRADNAERQRRFNESRRDRETRHAAGDHSKCKPEYCSGARGEAKGNLTNALHNAPQTQCHVA